MAEGKLLTAGPPSVSVVVLEAGEQAVATLLDYARQNELSAASLTAIGGFSETTLAFFDVDAKRYEDIPVNQQAEVLSLTGDIVRTEDDWQVHAHAVLGLRDGSTRGGHLREATVRPTLEVMVTDAPRELVRTYDADVGLALIDMAASSHRSVGEGTRCFSCGVNRRYGGRCVLAARTVCPLATSNPARHGVCIIVMCGCDEVGSLVLRRRVGPRVARGVVSEVPAPRARRAGRGTAGGTDPGEGRRAGVGDRGAGRAAGPSAPVREA